jgi:hypothetical protein
LNPSDMAGVPACNSEQTSPDQAESNPTGAVHSSPLAPPENSGLRRVLGPGCILGLLALNAPAEAELAAQRLSLRRLTASVLISRSGGGFPAVHASAVVNHDVLASHETQLPRARLVGHH